LTRDVHLLRLLQLFDSQFPVGAFAHSGGLETYAQAGGGLGELRSLLANQAETGWGRGELAAACLAWHAVATPAPAREIARLAALAGAFKVVPAIRDASVRLGARTLALVRRLYPREMRALDIAPPHHAVVIGAAGGRLDLPLRDVLLGFAQSLLAGNLAAATRCMPISPAQAQSLIVDLHPQLAAAVERALRDPEDALFTCTPGLDIRCDQQGRLHTRLFQS
jgi:urease accessory protein